MPDKRQQNEGSGGSWTRRSVLAGLASAGVMSVTPASANRGNGNGRGQQDQNIKTNCALDWSQLTVEMMRETGIEIPESGRIYVLTHVAMYDALNGLNTSRGQGFSDYDTYYVEPDTIPGASRVAAIAGAAHEMLTKVTREDAHALPKDTQETLLAMYDEQLESHLESDTDGNTEAGLEWGQYVAKELYDHRRDAGFFDEDEFDHVDDKDDLEPGQAQRCEQWGSSHLAYLDPWSVDDIGVVRPGEPPTLDSDEWAENYERTKKFGDRRIGADELDELPEDWEEIGIFWVALPGTAQPDGRWIQIAQTVAEEEDLSLTDATRLLAHVSIAVQDGGIAAWNSKRYYADHLSWRPHAAIGADDQDELVAASAPPNADDDGNPETEADREWEALSSYAASPEYPSGLTASSGTAARVLEHYFGEDYSFDLTVLAAPAGEEPVEYTRSFDNFREAFEEARDSREYSGRHYRHALEGSEEIAEELAPRVLKRLGEEP